MSIVVVGSCNVDLVMRCRRAPEAGETITGFADGFSTGVGGKGLNQAGACARQTSGGTGSVLMVGCVGSDANGELCLDAMRENGIETRWVERCEGTANGVALITVEEETGNNRIVLSAGANARLTPELVDRAKPAFEHARVAVFQLEVPLESTERGLELALETNAKSILNPAPAVQLDDKLLSKVSILIPNETEASILTGVQVVDGESAKEAGRQLLGRGVREAVLVTLGAQGVVACIRQDGGRIEEEHHKVPHQVDAVDTTAAGDSFIGGLAAILAEGGTLEEAIAHGQAVAAITVTRRGALGSIPTRQELA
ncbi:hypothetical protein PYCC9005_005618 [Savitreella phatthalungensis]